MYNHEFWLVVEFLSPVTAEDPWVPGSPVPGSLGPLFIVSPFDQTVCFLDTFGSFTTFEVPNIE